MLACARLSPAACVGFTPSGSARGLGGVGGGLDGMADGLFCAVADKRCPNLLKFPSGCARG